jgi:PIN domain nuclease of toxin-antitoxin system
MKILLDTHAFLWWISDDPRLPASARAIIADRDAEVFWSAASSWEVAIKYGNQRLPLPAPPERFLAEHLTTNRVSTLPVTNAHAWRVAELPQHHKDPFDRLLIAQAQVENMPILSFDKAFRLYDVRIVC